MFRCSNCGRVLDASKALKGEYGVWRILDSYGKPHDSFNCLCGKFLVTDGMFVTWEGEHPADIFDKENVCDQLSSMTKWPWDDDIT